MRYNPILVRTVSVACLLSGPVPSLQAQVGIGTSTVSPSAILEVKSTSKGLLLPRLTTAQRDAIASPQLGLVIYNSTTGFFQGYADGPKVNQEQTQLRESKGQSLMELWQSFKVSIAGQLVKMEIGTEVEIAFPSGGPSFFNAQLLAGIGTTGTVLQDLFLMTGSGGTTVIDFSSSPISVVAGSSYTLRLTTSESPLYHWVHYGWDFGIADPYPDGSSNFDDPVTGAYWDMKFKVYLRSPGWVDLH